MTRPVAAATTTTTGAAAPLAFDSPLGINGLVFAHHRESTASIRLRTELLRELGVAWDRSDLPWDQAEAAPGQWDWARHDALLAAYRDRNLQVLPILDYGAAWRGTEGPRTAEQRAEWANYVTRAVGRYRGSVDMFEVWNEPNIVPFWRPEPDARAYGLLLRDTARAAREANPAVRLVAFATADLDIPFIERTIEVAGPENFDVASYHVYRTAPSELETAREVFALDLLLERYGRGRVPIFITEMGATSYYPDGVSEAQQARSTARQIVTMLGSGAAKVFPFTLVDNAFDPGGPWGSKLGMVTLPPEARRKAVFYAFKTLVAQLGKARALGPVDLGPGTHAYLFAAHDADVNDPQMTLVAWTTGDARDVVIPVDAGTTTTLGGRAASPEAEKNFAYTTLDGTVRQIESYADVVRLSLSPDPIFVPIRSAWLRQNLATKWSPQALMASPGRPFTAQLDIALTGLRGEAIIAPPAGWEGLPNQGRRVVTAGNKIAYEFTPPPGVAAGWHAASARMATPWGLVEKALPIWVRPAMTGWARPVVTSGTAQIETRFAVRNVHLARPARWKFEAEPPLPGAPGLGALPEGRFDLPGGTRQVAGRTLAMNTTHTESLYHQEFTTTIPRAALQRVSATTNINFAYQSEGPGEIRHTQRALTIAVLPVAKTAPTLDGNLDEWNGVPAVSLGAAEQLVRGHHPPDAPRNAAATVRAQWTPEGLAVAADITDDSPATNPNGDGAHVHKGDGIEIYLGVGGYDGRLYRNGDDLQFALTPGIGGAGAAVSNYAAAVPGSKISVAPRPGGYTIEALIPTAALPGYKPTAGDILGFDAQLNDADTADVLPAGVNAPPTRSYMLNGTAQNWQKPGGWGLGVVR